MPRRRERLAEHGGDARHPASLRHRRGGATASGQPALWLCSGAVLDSTPLPSRLGPYRVLSRLGRGGACEVLLGESYGAAGFVRRVALKRLHEALADDPELVRALQREAQLGGLLRHPCLVQVWHLGLDDGRYFVAMEWIDGLDLATLLDREPAPPKVARAVARELARALDYLHRARDLHGAPLGLIHRDLSATNVLLSLEGEVKLADLGLAKATLLADRSRGDVRKGTYAYMSPEQVEHRVLTQASDQFSLGVLLAELFTGARPFDRDGELATLQAIADATPPQWPGLDQPTAELLRRCLARAPADRFPDLRELGRALAELGEAAAPPELASWVARGRATG